MGSITKMMKDLTGAEADEKEQKERLQVILMAAKARIAAFKGEIDEMFTNPATIEKKQIPGIRALRYIEQYHVASRVGFSEQVGNHMTAAIDAFFSIGDPGGNDKGAVKNGVKELISTALDAFIGSTEVGESEKRIYVVIPENNAFIRVDIACWKYHFEQHKLIDQKDTAVAYILCKSVIDHEKLALDELIYLASESMQTSAGPAARPSKANCIGYSNEKVREALLRPVQDAIKSTTEEPVRKYLQEIIDQETYPAVLAKFREIKTTATEPAVKTAMDGIAATMKDKIAIGRLNNTAADGIEEVEANVVDFTKNLGDDKGPEKLLLKHVTTQVSKQVNGQSGDQTTLGGGVLDIYRKQPSNGKIYLLQAEPDVVGKHLLDVSGTHSVRRPPSITDVGEYIEEMIRVWNKLRMDRAHPNAT